MATLPEPFVTAPDQTVISYTEARCLWRDGDFSDWLANHDPENIEQVGISGEWYNLADIEDQLSDDCWDED